jgi:hypothetical protein
MAIEITSKQKAKVAGWAKALFAVSLICLLGMGAAWWYLKSSAEGMKSNITERDQALLKKDSEKKIEDYLSLKGAKIDNFSPLISSHKKNFYAFYILESLTHPEVQFLDFSFTAKNDELRLSGTTKSFFSLGQQLLIFKNDTRIKQAKFSGISIGQNGNVSFSVLLDFDPNAFN